MTDSIRVSHYKVEDLPIPYDPTWDIIDSSKFSTFYDCPRRYFYEYLLGWRSTAPNNHTYFGEAWHIAQEHLLLNGYEAHHINDAFEKFINFYRMEFDEETDELYEPKTPERALKALVKYCQEHPDDHDKYEVLYTEIAGTVPIDADVNVHFRMDSILNKRSDNHKLSIDHKTGSSLNRQWQEKWPLSVAAGTYNHVLHCLYDPDEVDGLKFRGTFFKRTKSHLFDFTTVPVRKTPLQMRVWLWNILYQYDLLQHNMLLLQKCTDSDPVMFAFPMNPESCTKYFGCPYHDFCLAWANPLQRCDEPPMGFEVKFWNPHDRPKTNIMNVRGSAEQGYEAEIKTLEKEGGDEGE